MWLLPVAALNLIAGAAYAQSPAGDLQRIEGVIDRKREESQRIDLRARELEAETSALRTQLIETAARVQEHEQRRNAMAQRLNDAERDYQASDAAFQSRRRAIARSLGVLAKLSRAPSEALIARPAEWRQTVRAVGVIEQLVPTLNRRAAAIAEELEQLQHARIERAQSKAILSQELESLGEEQARLESLLARKSAANADLTAKRRAVESEIARLGAEAKDLRALVDRLLADMSRSAAAEPPQQAAPALPPPQAEEPAPAETAALAPSPAMLPSSLPWPVLGEVVRAYGEPDDSGAPGQGVLIRTADGAQVVAPRDGTAVYAGEFRSYGQLLIIEHRGEYHILLAGFARIHSEVGQSLAAGEPVGVMGGRSSAAPMLYIEIRRNGQPTDPAVWLGSGSRKVRG